MLQVNDIYYINQRVAIVRVNPQKADPNFIFFQVATDENEQYFFNKANGAGQPNLSATQIGELLISLPPYKTQAKIGLILKNYNNLIENNQKQIKLLEEAAQRLYKEWFVDFRFPGHGTTPIIDGMPDGWYWGTLDNIIEYHDKKRQPLSSLERESFKGNYRYFGAAGILDYVKDYLFDGTYLLLGEDGTVINNNGSPVLQYVTGRFWVNNHAHVLTGKDYFSTEYLYIMFKNVKVTDVVTGVAQPKISQARLSAKKVLIPAKQHVILYSNKIKAIMDKILLLQVQNDSLIELRNRLLSKLMQGKIEV